MQTLSNDVRKQIANCSDYDQARYVARKALGVSRLKSEQVREVEEIVDRKKRRSAERISKDVELSISQRLNNYLRKKYMSVIRARGGETHITESSGADVSLRIEEHSPKHGLTLLTCQGWRQYSRRFGARPASLSYLCGMDDNGPWAVRIPGTITTVGDAIEYVTPAVVEHAQNKGRRVLRQGDIYVVESNRDNTKGLQGTRHTFDKETRTLHHGDPDRPHNPLHVPFPARFVQQRVLAMGRSGRGAAGD